MGKWEIEKIPDEHYVFRRINKKCYVKKDQIPIGFYKQKGDNIQVSVDWEQYSSPIKCRNRAKRSRPEDNGVVEYLVKEIRQNTHKVCHDPTFCNRSHTLIIGEESKLKMALSRFAKWSKGCEL